MRKREHHGRYGTPEYRSWYHMIDRCCNPKDKSYKNYGERGISVSEEWRNSFAVFYRDMGARPTAHHTLERKDNSIGYEASNCIWATRTEQNNNTRANRLLTYAGKTQNTTQWALELGINPGTLRSRLHRGWGVERSLTS